MKSVTPDALTIYEAIGGEAAIQRLVQAFYPKVQAHPDLAPIFPEDIMPVMQKQFMFLSQFFGGPDLYSRHHGNPMMRARHMPFPITPRRAEAWLGCMREALGDIGLDDELADFVCDKLRGPAYHFINTDE